MDKRKHGRRKVRGDISGRMIHVEYLEIIDISLSGIRFNCLRSVNPNSTIRITILKGSISLKLKGSVVRSSLKNIKQIAGDAMPIYEVAMKFKDLEEKDIISLEKLIQHLDNE